MPATSSSPDLMQAEIDRRRGRIVPWVIAAFYVAFVLGFMAFVVIAFHNPPNEITAEAYAKGLAYNDILDKEAAQDQLGWTSQAVLENGRVVFTLTDADGRAVDGATVRAWFVHPSLAANDRSFDLTPDGEGRYAAPVALPVEAAWKLRITAEQNGRQYQSATTVEGK